MEGRNGNNKIKQGGVRIRNSAGANFDWLVREVFFEVVTFKLIYVFKKESSMLGSERRVFQAKRTVRTKALDRNELGVQKRERKPVLLEHVKVYTDWVRVHRSYKVFFGKKFFPALLRHTRFYNLPQRVEVLF